MESTVQPDRKLMVATLFQTKQIQNGFDNHTAADPTDRSGDGCQETDSQIKQSMQ